MEPEQSRQNERRETNHHEMLFMGVAIGMKQGDRIVYADVRTPQEAIKMGVDRADAEELFSRPGRSCHLIYSRWRWSGFKCDDDTCEDAKQCVLHRYDFDEKEWKICPSPGRDESEVYACFCV